MTVDVWAREVLLTRPKNSDIEYRVSLIHDDGVTFVDFREYVKSSDFYGRGMTMPLDEETAKELASRLLGGGGQ